MPGAGTIVVALSELACSVAMLPSFGPKPTGFVASRYDQIVRKIKHTSVSVSLGPDLAVRYLTLSVEEARELRTAFRDSAEAYRMANRPELVRPCAEAADTLDHALRAAGTFPAS